MTYGKAFGLCAAGAALIAAWPVSGAPVYVIGRSDVVTHHISYADLNLASAAGERTLTTRVRAAVGDVCDEATGPDNGGIEYKFNMHRCSISAWNQARPQMALAVQRAREIAMTGTSSITASALTITLPK
jgi:UrcA family protein